MKIGIVAILFILIAGTASAVTVSTGKLKIQAIPSTPKVGEEVTFLVTTELTNKPVADAEIWVAKVGAGETVDHVIQLLKEGKVGKSIGRTDQNGEFKYSFDDYGIYVVQAKKEGYVSGITTVEVKPLGRLKITTKKLGYASVCELPPAEGLAKMTVNDIIARCQDYIKVLIHVTDENNNPIDNAEIFINTKSMGYTNTSGDLVVSLKPGVYGIIAKKKGYLPGMNVTIAVTKEDVENKVKELIEEAKKKVEEEKGKIEETLKVLKVENPRVVGVGEEFEIKVTFKGEPVKDATVAISKHGIVVKTGKTDANGIYKTSLSEEGAYLITATKEGYRSGVSVVAVVPSYYKPVTFVHVMPVIEPGKPEVVKVGKAFVKQIEVKVKNTVKNVIVEVKQLKELPKSVPKPPGLVYAYVEINVSSGSNVEEGVITFNVSKKWLMEKGIDKNEIVLMKYINGRWITLETKVISEDNNYVYYQAKTPSFSVYAIGTKTTAKTTTTTVAPTTTTVAKTTTTVVTTPPPTTTKKIPGFEIALTLIGAGSATIFRSLRRRI